uniref:B-cell receptor CD22-like isoform X1 n=2 Tax=Pogona vitticeps TaxID=103695 RepID=A0ABM5EQZ9_9SAUR
MSMQTLSPFSQVKVWLLHESTLRHFFLLLFLEGFLCNSEGSLSTEPESEVLYLPQWTKGIARDDLRLSTDSPPKLKLEIYPEDIQEALPANVSCSVSYHFPDEPIKMILSGLEQQHISAHISTDENGKVCKELRFVPTWKYHGKWLTCSLINNNEEVISQNTMKLDVKHAPKGVQLRADPGPTLREGEKLSLECLVKSSNPVVFEYQWWKDDDRTYEGINGSRMEINPVGRQHSGRYGCGAINALGTSESQELTIHVQDAPKGVELRAYPGPTLQEGETLSLDCRVNSSHPVVLGYQWLRNNHLIAGRINGSRMEIDPVERQHAGHYRCRTRNALGTTESNALIIDVQYPPKEIKIPSRKRTIEENDVVNLKCSFIANPPITKYEWYKTPASNVVSSQRELRFQAIQASDSGTYYCKAYNPVGQSTSSLFTLDVRYAPKPVELRASPGTTLREGETLSLECLVRTSQRAVLEYQWWKDNHLTNGRINESRMTIDPVGRQHSGRYKCGARTTLGTTESNELPIDVQYPPDEPKIAFSSRTGKEDVTLHCWSTANPPITHYEWYKCPALDIISSQIELHFPMIQPNNSGGYYCKAYNPIGHSTSSVVTLNIHSGVCH